MLYPTRLPRLRCVRAALVCAGLLAATSILSGCHGAFFGSGFGALAGQAIGGDTESTVAGALIGAHIGAAVENPSYHHGPQPSAHYHYPHHRDHYGHRGHPH